MMFHPTRLFLVTLTLSALLGSNDVSARAVRGRAPIDAEDATDSNAASKETNRKLGKMKYYTSDSIDIGLGYIVARVKPYLSGTVAVPVPVPVPVPYAVPVPSPQFSLDIAGTLDSRNGLDNCYQLFSRAGLVNTLKGAGPFTVFAPKNSAWTTPQAFDAVISLPQANLKSSCSNHIVRGSYRSSDLVAGMRLTTLQGSQLLVGNGPNGLKTVNNVIIREFDIGCGNGLIHSIDSFIL